MELVGFFYDNREERIDAHGCTIPKSLVDKGYIQKCNAYGEPRWYVKPLKVTVILEIDGENRKFNIYNNIMALYPDRSRISLKLAQEVIAKILNGDIEITMKNDKPFLVTKKSKSKKH